MDDIPSDPDRKLRHDLRGCLNTISLSVEVLSDDLEPTEALEILDGLSRAADKMLVLMDQLPLVEQGD